MEVDSLYLLADYDPYIIFRYSSYWRNLERIGLSKDCVVMKFIVKIQQNLMRYWLVCNCLRRGIKIWHEMEALILVK